MIPEPNATIKTEDVNRTHSQYDNYVRMFQFLRDTYQNRGGYELDLQRVQRSGEAIDDWTRGDTETTYLSQYAREHSEKFRARQKQVFCAPYVKLRVIQPLVGFLTTKPPERSGYDQFFLDWLDNATLDGQSFDSWLATEGMPWGLTYGALPIVIDSDYHTAETEAERLEQGAQFAKLRVIHPDRLIDWGRDLSGKLQWIKYETEMDSADPLLGHVTWKRYRWITPEGWFYIDVRDDNKTGDGYRVNASGLWPSNFTQAPLTELRFLSGEGIVRDVAPLVRRLFNVLSELTESQRGQCFAILRYPSREDLDALTVGVHNVLGFDPDSRHAPEYVAPPTAPMEHLTTWVDTIVQLIQEVGGTSSIFGAGAEAAATLAYRFQVTSKLLSTLSGDAVNFEYDVANIVYQWYGKQMPDDATTVYVSTFDAIDTERFLANVDTAINEIGLPPTAEKIARRRVVNAIIPDRTNDEDEQIEIELQTGTDETTQAAEQAEPVI